MTTNCWIIGVIIAAAVAFWGVGALAVNAFGFKRILEHGPDWPIAQLEDLKKPEPDKASRATRYAFPILFPLDLIEMILIAGACAIASVVWGHYLGVPPSWLWLVLLLPCLYLAADLAEDTLLAFLLTTPEAIPDRLVSVVRGLTSTKLYAVKLAMGQAGLIAIAAGALALYRQVQA
jgi:hypothetical protein